jgi:hypothetical protein
MGIGGCDRQGCEQFRLSGCVEGSRTCLLGEKGDVRTGNCVPSGLHRRCYEAYELACEVGGIGTRLRLGHRTLLLSTYVISLITCFMA